MGEDESGERQSLPLQVQTVRDALVRDFTDLIEGGDGAFPLQVFLSQAMAARSVQILTGCSVSDAAAAVTDGPGDLGIDAVAASPATGELWLVQTKWSDRGRTQFRPDAVHKLLAGFRALDSRDFGRFNPRLQALADRIDQVLSQPRPRIYLVLAGTGDTLPGPEIHALADTAAEEFGSTVQVRALTMADFLEVVQRESALRPVELQATFTGGWFRQEDPHPAFVGTVDASEVARWYEEHGQRLFGSDVRSFLGGTEVNEAIVASARKNPDAFWYFNNGITVLCQNVTAEYFSRRAPGQPVRLSLQDASIVNGVQTAASLYQCYAQDPAATEDIKVMLRVITLRTAPDGFAQEVTRATNTLNSTRAQDFVGLDPVQVQLREEFRSALGKEYVLRRGDLEPAPEAGCTAIEAAVALGCAHPDAGVSARVRADSDVLWQQGPDGVYPLLFGGRPSAEQVWRSVLVHRTVQHTLFVLEADLRGRAAATVQHGALLVAHLVFQRLGTSLIDDPDADWDTVLQDVPGLVRQSLAALVRQVDAHYGVHSMLRGTFTSPERCRNLARAVLAATPGDDTAATLELTPRSSSAARQPRRPSSVRLLVDRGLLAEGTQLMYVPSGPEELALREWLDADPRRFLATWHNDARRPLVWAVDRNAYSPSGLLHHLWEAADWRQQPVAVNGSTRWRLPGGPTLAELAQSVWVPDSAGPSDAGGGGREDGPDGA
ncbi:AIPR family protein [Kitasatospora sp. NPDC088783]|uniref:AIPR family protein n=1 Tax=Kitasatospora sp. NPDC088783 TaxID=3364077 RepID=UPI0038026542